MSEPELIVVEIPGQYKPRAYVATRSELIAEAWERWGGNTEPEPVDFDTARESLASDLHGLFIFETRQEAAQWAEEYPKGPNRHQWSAATGLLLDLLEWLEADDA